MATSHDPATLDTEDRVQPASRGDWRDWLAAHHERETGVWFVYAKVAAPESMPRVSVDEAIEEALCFGWIDSRPRKLDDHRSMLWFAPRRAGSGWSALNKRRIERVTQAGLMTPAGQRLIDAAQADGSWSLLDDVEALTVPDDLAAELARYESAAAYFAAFPPSVRRGILEWIVQAKRPDTRARRIAETAELAEHDLRANQWPRQTLPAKPS